MVSVDIMHDLNAQESDVFAAFVETCPYWSYQQTPLWPKVVPPKRSHSYCYAIGRVDDEIVTTAVVRRSPLAGKFWMATSQRGPLVRSADMLAPAIQAIGKALARHNACTWQMAPRVRGRDLPAKAEVMRIAGAKPLPPGRQPLHVATGIVWLDKPEADILAGFSQGQRRKLKQAVKDEVVVRPVENADDLALFQSAMDIFRRNRPDYSMSGIPDAAGQRVLTDAIGGAMLLAERHGELLGAASFVRQGDEAIWLTLATTDARPKIPSNDLLLWEAMRLARTMGAIGYDLAGMPVDAPHDADEAGRMQFKNGFRPHKRVMLPMHSLALKPVAHKILFTARQAARGLGN